MNPAIVLKLVISWGLDLLQLLLNPKVWLLLAVAAAAGFIKGCEKEKEHFDSFKAQLAVIQARQDTWLKDRIQHNKSAQAEVEAAHEKDRQERADRFGALYARYAGLLHRGPDERKTAGSGVQVAGPADPVHPVGIACYDAARLQQGVNDALDRYRASVGSALAGIIGIVQRGEDFGADARWWGDWARRVESCPALEGPAPNAVMPADAAPRSEAATPALIQPPGSSPSGTARRPVLTNRP